MKKNIFILFLLLSINIFSQNGNVGINTSAPQATLDIRGKNDNTPASAATPGGVAATDGVLVPRVSDLVTNGTINGQLVYLVADTTTPAFTKGFYYWNGTVWASVGGGADGDAWGVTGEDLTSAIKRTGSVSIGSIATTAPDASAILELNVSQLATGSKKGFLGPRVSLTAYNDSTTIPSPAQGLLVYNLGTISTFTYIGYVYWDGSEWRTLDGRSLRAGTISSLGCSQATMDPISYTSGNPFNGTITIPYFGGNGGIYAAQSIGPVNGLTATLSAGNFANGAGSLIYTVTGTPSVTSPTTTTFPISIGGQSCNTTVGLGKVLAPGEYQFFTYTLPATYVGLLSTQVGSTYDAILGSKVKIDLNFTSSSNLGSGGVTYNPRLVNIFSSNIKIWYSALSSVDRFRRANILLAPNGYLETDNGIYLNWGDNMNSSSTALTAATGSDDSQEIETIDLIVDGIWYRLIIFVTVDNLNDTSTANNIRRVFITAQRMSN